MHVSGERYGSVQPCGMDRSGAGEKGKAASAVWTRSLGYYRHPSSLWQRAWHPGHTCDERLVASIMRVPFHRHDCSPTSGTRQESFCAPEANWSTCRGQHTKKQRPMYNTCQTYDLLYLLFSIERIYKNVQISSGGPKSSSRLGPLSSGDIYPSTLLSKVPLISITHRNN
jgi:hypothetical protein